MLDPKLREEIDACRPGSRDVDGPDTALLADALRSDDEVRAAYATVQRFDARVGTTMHAVPVPDGLASRILSRLESAVAANTAPLTGRAAALAVEASPALVATADAAAVEPKSPSSLVEPAQTGPRFTWTRRRLLAAGGLLAASVLLPVALMQLGRQNDVGQVALTERAAGWYERLDDAWQPLSKLPRGFAVPSGIGSPVRGWQAVGSTVAKSGVVYALGTDDPARRQGVDAVLFVLKVSRPELPSMAPRTPQSTTAGLAIGAWQSNGLVYVLVVRGDQRAYKKFFHPVQPLA